MLEVIIELPVVRLRKLALIIAHKDGMLILYRCDGNVVVRFTVILIIVNHIAVDHGQHENGSSTHQEKYFSTSGFRSLLVANKINHFFLFNLYL